MFWILVLSLCLCVHNFWSSCRVATNIFSFHDSRFVVNCRQTTVRPLKAWSGVEWVSRVMAPRRMETKPVIFCLKSLLLLYCFIFWVTDWTSFSFQTNRVYSQFGDKQLKHEVLLFIYYYYLCFISAVFNQSSVTFKQHVSFMER